MEESSSEFSLTQDPGISEYHDYRKFGGHGRFITGTIAGFGRRWFVKSLTPELKDSTQARQSLRKEFEILLALNHPGVVRAVELRELPGIGLSIIMEYAPGEHLSPASGLSKSARRKIARQLVDVIAYIHSKGITHGDLKPENIIIDTSSGDPKLRLIDFNMSDAAEFIVNKEAGGNKRYGSPEQFEKNHKLDPRDDVWGLGMLLREISPGLSWQPAIRRALVRNPERRIPNAGAFSRYLRASRYLSWLIPTFLIIALIAAGLLMVSTTESQKEDNRFAEKAVKAETPLDVDADPSETLPESMAITPPQTIEHPEGIIENKTEEKPDLKEVERLNQEVKKVEQQVRGILAEGEKEIKKLLNDSSLVTKTRHNKISTVIMKTDTRATQCVTEFRAGLPQEYQFRWPDEWDDLFRGRLVYEFDSKYSPVLNEMGERIRQERMKKEAPVSK